MHPAKVSGFLCCHWGLSWGFSVPALTPPRLKAEKNQEAVRERERVHDEVEIAVKTESALNYCNFYIAALLSLEKPWDREIERRNAVNWWTLPGHACFGNCQLHPCHPVHLLCHSVCMCDLCSVLSILFPTSQCARGADATSCSVQVKLRTWSKLNVNFCKMQRKGACRSINCVNCVRKRVHIMPQKYLV